MRLYPIYHPAAALYTPRMLATLREDFARIPALLAQGAPEQPPSLSLPAEPAAAEAIGEAQADVAAGEAAAAPEGDRAAAAAAGSDQLGLF